MPFDGGNAQAVKVSREEILHALEHDRETFIAWAMGELLEFPVPEFHIQVFNRMLWKEVDRLVLALPRGHAKTTLAKLAVVWHVLFSPNKFYLYVSNTHTIARDAVKDIVAFMETDNFKTLFGDLQWKVKQDQIGFYHFVFRDRVYTIRALGANQQVRGLNVNNTRPDFVIVDDLEDEQNSNSDEQQANLRRWVFGPLFKAVNAARNKIVWIGNMISKKGLLNFFCESSYWHSMVMGALLENGQPLWPDLWPISKLRQDFQFHQQSNMLSKWFAEMMNMPVAAEGGLMDIDKIDYLERPLGRDGISYGFITIDPAQGKTGWANKAAIVVHGWVHNRWMPVDWVHERGLDPVQIFMETINLAMKWGVRIIGIEAAAMQAGMASTFNYLAVLHEVQFLEFYPVIIGNQDSKTVRLKSWTGLLASKEYALPLGDTEITSQIMNYDAKAKHNEDDLIDGCALGVKMIGEFLPKIMEAVNDNAPGRVKKQGSLHICAN